jgi:hypothetical protein
MTIEQYWAKSKGTFPKVGVVGVESEWMEVGTIQVPDGMLWAGDPHLMDGRASGMVKVPKGPHRVEIKGMDFKGHRRTARVRVFLKGRSKATLGKACGETFTDSAWVGVCDYPAYKKAVTPKREEEYEKDILAITKEQGIGITAFEFGGKRFDMTLMPSGLGDGTFTIYPLKHKGKTVGMEVEFLPPGFKVEPKAGGMARVETPKINKAEARKFMSACKKGNVKLAGAMLKKNPGLIHARGPHGVQEAISPLHMAASEGQTQIAELLLKHGHPVDLLDQFQCTPLHDAASYGHTDVVKLLLKHQAQVNHRNHVQETPLHAAIYPAVGRAELVKVLLKAGADPTVKDHFKNTPLNEARGDLNDPNYEKEEQQEAKKVFEIVKAAAQRKK